MSAAQPKTTTLYGLLIKPEASYNAGGAVAGATDGVLLSEPAEMTINYMNDGARGRDPGSGATRKRVKPSGRSGETTFKVEGRGRGEAYAAGAMPEANALLRASGHAAALDVTVGAETVTYTPISDPTTFASSTAEAYARGQKYPLTGILCDFNFTAEAGDRLMLEFPTLGLVGIPSDTAVPAISYPGADPPKVENIALTLGAYSPVVQSVNFKAGRKRTPRKNGNATAHGGWAMGGRESTLEIVIEAEALGTWNPYQLREDGTSVAVSMVIGSVKYNIIEFTAPVAQIITVQDGSDDEVATWTITLSLAPSAPGENDDYSLIYR